MNYSEAVSFLDSYVNYEKLPDYRWTQAAFRLDRMFRMLELLGDPHTKYPLVHVAGTKGKGSTCAFAASVLQEHGLKAGLYLSPHVRDLRERISIDGSWIEKEDFAQLMGELRPAIEQVEKEMIPTTYFEILTALAMMHFAREKADVAVFEVGIGGRLDATNVVTPVVSVITSIGFDHTDKLGDTLGEIAGEKCGIVKPGVPVVSAPQVPEASETIERICAQRGSPLRVITDSGEYEVSKLGIEGIHQRVNAACAMGALEELEKAGLVKLDSAKVAGGLAKAFLSARFQVVPGEPCYLLDGAHNEDSLKALVDSLRERADLVGRKKVALVGLASDKDLRACLAVLNEVVDEFIFTRTSNPRAAAPEELLKILTEFGAGPARAVEDIGAAHRMGLEAAGSGGLVIVTGSFYLAGDIASIIMNDAEATG